MLLELNQVTKTYAGKNGQTIRAIADVSLQLDAGQFVAICGPSGCGKSSLLLTAGTLLAPDTGEVRIAGEHPFQMSGDSRAVFRAKHLGFVFQQFHLVPYLSVLENVLATVIAIPRADPIDARDRAAELLKRYGLESRLDHTPNQLSSGERQRCALARAMLNRPALLLADEPTGNLDPENTEIVLRSLREFTDQGGAVLLVTHDEQATRAADRGLRMVNGAFEAQSG